MTDLKFLEYDRGNCRAYFKSNKKLFCFMANWGLQFNVCSKDGEPSHPELNTDKLIFTGFDKMKWAFTDILEYFRPCLTDGQIIRKMNELWSKS